MAIDHAEVRRIARLAHLELDADAVASNLARFDGVRYGLRVSGGAGLDAMYRRSRARGFGREVTRRIMLGTFALSAGYYDRFYGRAQRARTLLRRDFTNVFDSGIDVLLAPVTPTAAFPCEAPPWAIERGAGAQDH